MSHATDRTIVPGIWSDVFSGKDTNFPALKTVTRDAEGKTVHNTVFGEMTVGFRRDDISIQYQYNNSTRDLVITETGTGDVANADSMASCSSGTGIGTARIQSRSAVRYRPGHECVMMGTCMFSAGEAGVKSKFGIFNTSDGLAFGYNGTTFGIWYIEGGNENFVAQSAWSHDTLSDKSEFNLNHTKLNLYKITFGWLGIATIYFSVYGGYDKGWILCHAIDRANIDTEPHLDNPSLPITLEVVRASGTGTAIVCKTASWRAGVIGGDDELNTSDRWFQHSHLEVSVTGSGTRNAIFTIANKSTYQSKTNHVQVDFYNISIDNSLNKTCKFYLTKNGTLSGATAADDVDADNSVCTHQDGGTVSGGETYYVTLLKTNSDRYEILEKTGLTLYPGESFTVEAVAASAVTGTVSVSVRWVERF